MQKQVILYELEASLCYREFQNSQDSDIEKPCLRRQRKKMPVLWEVLTFTLYNGRQCKPGCWLLESELDVTHIVEGPHTELDQNQQSFRRGHAQWLAEAWDEAELSWVTGFSGAREKVRMWEGDKRWGDLRHVPRRVQISTPEGPGTGYLKLWSGTQ